MGTIWDGTCEDKTRVPWLGSETYGARFPFPQIILVVGGGWGVEQFPNPPVLLGDISFDFCPPPHLRLFLVLHI